MKPTAHHTLLKGDFCRILPLCLMLTIATMPDKILNAIAMNHILCDMLVL